MTGEAHTEGPVLDVPALSLVVLVGASGSGKSTFARRHFRETEIVSSDACRGLVADDENDQSATPAAFALLDFICRTRLAGGRLTVVDATSVRREDRAKLVEIARRHHALATAIVFDLPERVCQDRNALRPDRQFGPHVVRNQVRELRRGLRGLRREGFQQIHVLRSVAEIDSATIRRTPLWSDKRHLHGPFDIVGDVHGCADELAELLRLLGYAADGTAAWRHPEGRTVVFVGDLVDRGPRSLDVLETARTMVEAGTALCVPGNHDVKLARALRGADVTVAHGLDRTLAEVEGLPPERREEVTGRTIRFIDGLVSHLVLDDGRLVVAHAGMKEEMQGRGSAAVRDFALFGETTGETDEFGLPVRHDWARGYRGSATVVFGHTPVPEPEWLNNTIDIDTGCVFGGRLTALRWPERELVSVAAHARYATPARPFAADAAADLSAQQRADDLLDIEDVTGKRFVSTRLGRTVAVREENAAAALEVMGRFAIDPRWLVYLPPTVAAPATSAREGLLEHPEEAITGYREAGVEEVLLEEKHMGSRAVLVVLRDPEVARTRFGVPGESIGVIHTRTGRSFFDDPALTHAVLDRIRSSAEATGLFDELASDWLILDAEIMPWSAKAGDLIARQYAAVGAAGAALTESALALVEQGVAAGQEGVAELLPRARQRAMDLTAYREAYRRYAWPVRGVDDLRVAPFHLLASEGRAHLDGRTHRWHLDRIDRLVAEGGPLLASTRRAVVRTTDPASVVEGVGFWESLVGAGGEGVVVKPADVVTRGPRGLVQPAVKVRGPEYLRIIYGPEYRRPENLERLRDRKLGRKRALALREFALGAESLERFVRGEPLRRVHECVFAVLALESEPVDPRL